MTNSSEYKPTGAVYELRTYADFMSLSDEQFAMMLPDFLEHKKCKSKFDRALLEALVIINKHVDPAHGFPIEVLREVCQLDEVFEWLDDGTHGAINEDGSLVE